MISPVGAFFLIAHTIKVMGHHYWCGGVRVVLVWRSEGSSVEERVVLVWRSEGSVEERVVLVWRRG